MSDLKPRKWSVVASQSEDGQITFPREELEQLLLDSAALLIRFGGSVAFTTVRIPYEDGEYETVEVRGTWMGAPARKPPEPEPEEAEQELEPEPVELKAVPDGARVPG